MIRYEVRNVAGALVAVHVRRDHPDGSKSFSWERPDGASGLGGLRVADLPLYGAHLLRARFGESVIVCEGERAAQVLIGAGLLAVGTVTGASGTPSAEALAPIAGREVLLWPDHDDPGRAHMLRIAEVLRGLGATPRLIDWPDGPPGGDAADFVDEQGPGMALDHLLAAAIAPAGRVDGKVHASPDDDGREARGTRKPSQATLLVALVAGADLFHTPEGTPYATVPVDDHHETWPVRSRTFRRWLARRFFTQTGGPPNAQAMTDALGVVEARGLFDGVARPVFVRLAPGDEVIHLDLGDARWRVVEITATGWRITSDAPVRFRRPAGLLPLPEPVRGGSIEALRPFVNVGSDADWRLLVAATMAMLQRGPYPILILYGEQGAAKTTTARVQRAVLDPNVTPVRAEPREVRDLMIAATNSWTQAYDNLSHLPAWLSDALCRLSTGGGFAARELYSDADEVLFDAMRPVIITSIEEIATRGDLLDRSLIVYLPSIPEERRRPEAEFWTAFAAAHPQILGAVLDTASAALRALPTTRFDSLPRMADFARWATAAEGGLGWAPGSMVAAYRANRAAAHELALDASPVATMVRALLDGQAKWSGTATDLLALLNGRADDATRRQRGWPGSLKALAGVLRRLTPNLRAVGVEVEFGRANRARVITIRKGGEKPVTTVTNGVLTPSAGDGSVTDRGNRQDARPNRRSDACDANDAFSAPSREAEEEVTVP